MLRLLLAVLLGVPCPCLYDRDIGAERAALPGAYEAILGFIPRRTREYYERRLRQVADEAAAAGGMTPGLYDDQAVAEARLGRVERGVALLREKEERFPGQFTTAANIGWLLAMQERYGAAAEALERAAQLGSDEQRSQATYLLLLVRWRDRLERDRAGAANTCMLGFDVAEKLGQEFRTAAAPETEVAPLLAQLGLRSDVYEALVGLIVLDPEQAEPYFALAELLAARGDRKLAWHAYQRAYDLEHPRSVDILLFQDQVRAGLSRDGQTELTSLAHVRLRRRALEWQKAWQTFERQLIAAGRDPAEPAALARFRAEHPVP